MGVEILNGAVAHDTVYTILRTGTFIGDFSDALEKFYNKKGTKLIVIVPNEKVFMSNFGKNLREWITKLYVNPNCEGLRALVLEPGLTAPNKERVAGYLFVSDGHTTQDDDGFYASTMYSKNFLLGYFKALIASGKEVKLPRKMQRLG